jgi:polyhydroxyalkanoate synthesis regulator phasin
MPKKQQKETAEEQAARFQEEVQKLVDAGELNPTEADAALDALVLNQHRRKP